MTDLASELTVAQTAALLTRYGFELKGYTPLELIEQWLRLYPAKWVRLAVIEALYQGRYKAISVEHILGLWQRRGQPTFHFPYDFERLIFRVLPQLTQDRFSSSSSSVALSYNTDLSLARYEDAECAQRDRALSPDKIVRDDSYSLAEETQQNKPLLPSDPQKAARPSTEIQFSSELESSVLQLQTASHLENSSKNEEKIPLADNLTQKSSFYSDRETKTSGSLGQPIHEFTPAIDPSDFYSKLKAVVEQDLENNPEAKRDELG
ncbi:MAG: hypothetical protein MUD14_20905 [Hydrococcus sp. Prado102]|nr:hypothetical protein [Hydrococcus sp. Prado102]